MSSMETVIVLTAIVASAAGALILLSCLANKRAQLIQQINQMQEHAAREQQFNDEAMEPPEQSIPAVG